MKSDQLTLPQLYAGGAFAGLCNSIISGPMEHVRTRLQVQSGPVKEFKGPYDFIKRIGSQYGISGLYKGQMITLARELHGYGIYFMVYEAMIQKTMKDVSSSIDHREIFLEIKFHRYGNLLVVLFLVISSGQ